MSRRGRRSLGHADRLESLKRLGGGGSGEGGQGGTLWCTSFTPFLGEGFPTKIDYRKKDTLTLTSLLEDLARIYVHQPFLRGFQPLNFWPFERVSNCDHVWLVFSFELLFEPTGKGIIRSAHRSL